ncbi:hypothetical protein HDF24_22970 [Mucilaginibacter sp. X4EP1]|uniref:hypothetical protein n=1 Tax=Mucilaginibacter sp. X4EP1 TaxID=2723092 RepID=UPI002167C7AE|nr:hypothetical protein [Mucilaginibacter sp. X4EP1]MCS3815996.1 hypothetical protein [Mucilaginibacter sp. X4EP1]
METFSLAGPLLLGGLLGLTGQSIRVIVGLKKTYDSSVQQSTQFKDAFDGKQLLISLLIGFVAGLLATLLQLSFDPKAPQFTWTKDIAVEIIAVGYAGADFIEGFMKKYLPAQDSTAVPNAAATTTVTGLSTDNIVG